VAIIKCPECGASVSDKAHSCPHCEYKITDKIGYTENQYKGKTSSIIGFVINIIGLTIFFSSFQINSDASGVLMFLGIIMMIGGSVLKFVGKAKY
jgi:hypothetical protein